MTKNWAGAVAEAQQAALRKALESSPLALKPRNRGAERRSMTMTSYSYRNVCIREWSRVSIIEVYSDDVAEYFDNIPEAVARFIELVKR